MRKIRTKHRDIRVKPKNVGYQLYCTIDGVLTPVVYKNKDINDVEFYEEVSITKRRRLSRQKSLQNTRSFNTPVIQDSTVINPLFVFNYNSGIKEVTSGNNLKTWNSSIGTNQLTMPVTATQPDIGLKGNGIAGVSPIYFNYDNSDYMIFSSGVTLTGDFTIFMYLEPIPLIPKVHKKHRFLGKSDDNDMYFSIGESGNTSYTLSFSSISKVKVSITPEYWQPSSKKILITLQRSGTNLYIRENGVQVASETVPTTDFAFNQFGIIGGLTSDTYNGSLYHASAYDGYITTELASLERAIIKKASLAKG
jgi:hypothetical protein